MTNEPEMLVICFDPADQKVYNILQDRLSQLTQKSPDVLAPLMVKGRMVVKRNAHREKDRELFDLLNSTGAQCSFVRPAIEPAPLKKDVPQSPELVDCPHCGYKQAQGDECIRCGVIYAKAKHRHPTTFDVVEAVQTAASVPETGPTRYTGCGAESDAPPAARSIGRPEWGKRIRQYWQWLKGHPLNASGLLAWSQRLKDAVTRAVVMFVVALVIHPIRICRADGVLGVARCSGDGLAGNDAGGLATVFNLIFSFGFSYVMFGWPLHGIGSDPATRYFHDRRYICFVWQGGAPEYDKKQGDVCRYSGAN